MTDAAMPAPWWVRTSDDYTSVLSSRDNERVALFETGPTLRPEIAAERKATAALIAAAPALNQAAMNAVTVLTADTIGTHDMDDPEWYKKVDAVVAELQAALVQACAV